MLSSRGSRRTKKNKKFKSILAVLKNQEMSLTPFRPWSAVTVYGKRPSYFLVALCVKPTDRPVSWASLRIDFEGLCIILSFILSSLSSSNFLGLLHSSALRDPVLLKLLIESRTLSRWGSFVCGNWSLNLSCTRAQYLSASRKWDSIRNILSSVVSGIMKNIMKWTTLT